MNGDIHRPVPEVKGGYAMLQASVIETYVDRIYDYALRKTYTREKADELSQEILFTLVRELPKLRDERRFEPWLWSVAGNVAKSFRRSMGKQRAMYFYDVPEEIVYDEAAAEEAARNEELYASLREKIAMLSSVYRNIIILYYYEGLSTKQISERLSIPEGTVTWRLSEARRKLKKESTHMEESALRPIQMRIDIYGSGNYNGREHPFPSEYIKDALSQNILYHCYKEPRGIEELAKLCGVPAYYIEDCIENLTARDAVTEPVRKKYQTAFLIWTDEYWAGEAIRNGYLKRLEDGSLTVMTPAFTKEQKKSLDQSAEKHLGPLMDEYCRIVDEYIEGYRKLFPKHLAETSARMCKTSFLNLFVEIITYAQEHGEIPLPQKDSVCDVLLQN